jgi:hypothetical protein
MTSTVDHPVHYNSSAAACQKCGHPIECIDVVECYGFSIGNAIKYLWRADHKGATIQDLNKAIWYINREIQRKLKDEAKSKGKDKVASLGTSHRKKA